MENLSALSDFLTAIAKDFRISTTHITVYAVLLMYRIDKGFINLIKIY